MRILIYIAFKNDKMLYTLLNFIDNWYSVTLKPTRVHLFRKVFRNVVLVKTCNVNVIFVICKYFASQNFIYTVFNYSIPLTMNCDKGIRDDC